LACPLQLAKTITRPPTRQQGVPEIYPDGALHGAVVVPAEQQAAACLSVGDASCPSEADDPFGDQPVATGIPRCHQPDRPAQQIRGDIR